MAPDQTNLLQGTLDMMILKSLALAEMHGLGISRRIEHHQGNVSSQAWLAIPGFASYGRTGVADLQLGRVEKITGARKYYRLTTAGRKQLEAESKRWGRISWAISQAWEGS